MSIALENMVDPEAYDKLIYKALHNVVDRVIELGAKADTSEENDSLPADPEDPDSEATGFINVLRSQANFTPAERAEFQSTGTVLHLLISVAVSRRSGLYSIEEEINP